MINVIIMLDFSRKFRLNGKKIMCVFDRGAVNILVKQLMQSRPTVASFFNIALSVRSIYVLGIHNVKYTKVNLISKTSKMQLACLSTV